MKKFLVCLLSLTLLLGFVGCKKTEKPVITYPEEKKINFTIGDQEYPLNSKGTFKAMRFRENPYDCVVGTSANTHMMSYSVDNNPAFQVVDVYFEGQTIDEVIAEVEAETTEKKVGDITYRYYETSFQDEQAREVITHNYLYEFEGVTYLISFYFADVETNIEQVYMENVRFVQTTE